ncbi:hypothetical protein FOB58_005361 [Candida parapsilosis]|uniref:Uncharacterized protein n=2 Tax=Candida parapsilosis TaxID=5480 RepID=G8B4Z9_CANPC|nr:uncharacterized protein CPAR2_601110 [Candida parapsilosis]KAF6043646.1 hypothetical protein FOB58_005361 [Candida parapsilosis]KAF6043857.1 hypothetical protein FOB59_004813 [Candida parapsilosis]KAF6045523.1 hypothetical protein FOB60_005095 [Candida parapsilosis]KAF6060310.1 hypothetical protein FOB61_005325 [Candida parapsilosis]KAI5905573.1 hypothetical protein K4G60_g4833 [Candida parapsilosis]
MTSIDNEVNLEWFNSYVSYTTSNNLTPDKGLLEKKQKLESTISKQQQQQQQQLKLQRSQAVIADDAIDISQDAPHLVRLIESQETTEELTKELKNLLIKYYWAGFELHDKLQEVNIDATRKRDDIVDENSNAGEV